MPPPANTRSQDSRRDPKLKRLLIRPGAIGDTIVSLPALEFCRADFTEVWVREECVPLIHFADRVRAISSTGLDLLELGLKTPAGDALRQFDSIVSWYGSNRSEFRQSVAHLPFTFHSALPPCSDLHAVDFYLRQVGGPDGAIPVIRTESAMREFVVIHPFSGSARKNWPLERFRELSRQLRIPAEFCVGPAEAFEGATCIGNLGQLASWLGGARAYVGNDSGITHLAAAVGVPVVAIFLSSDPAVWAPRGRAGVRTFEGDVPVEQVKEAVESLLTGIPLQ